SLSSSSSSRFSLSSSLSSSLFSSSTSSSSFSSSEIFVSASVCSCSSSASLSPHPPRIINNPHNTIKYVVTFFILVPPIYIVAFKINTIALNVCKRVPFNPHLYRTCFSFIKVCVLNRNIRVLEKDEHCRTGTGLRLFLL